jgi:predicted DsbA family dithiol-disulfide isomerase
MAEEAGNMIPLAQEIGLDGDKFSKYLDGGEMMARVNQDR